MNYKMKLHINVTQKYNLTNLIIICNLILYIIQKMIPEKNTIN